MNWKNTLGAVGALCLISSTAWAQQMPQPPSMCEQLLNEANGRVIQISDLAQSQTQALQKQVAALTKELADAKAKVIPDPKK